MHVYSYIFIGTPIRTILSTIDIYIIYTYMYYIMLLYIIYSIYI